MNSPNEEQGLEMGWFLQKWKVDESERPFSEPVEWEDAGSTQCLVNFRVTVRKGWYGCLSYWKNFFLVLPSTEHQQSNQKAQGNKMSLVPLFTDLCVILTFPVKNLEGDWILPCWYLQSCMLSNSKVVCAIALSACLYISSKLFSKAELLLPAKAPRCFPFHLHFLLVFPNQPGEELAKTNQLWWAMLWSLLVQDLD